MKHIVLVTYGEPPSPAFHEQLVYSWRILLGLTRSVADIPAALLPVIALSRARGRNTLWRRERYSSPLEAITLAQAAQLRNALSRRSNDQWKIHVAYEFRDPLLAKVIGQLPRQEPVFVVPMYAADSAFTHDLSRQVAHRQDPGRPAPISVLPAIPVERLADVSANHVMHTLESDHAKIATSALVLAAHGTLLQPAKSIETGRVATEQLCAAISRRLAPHFGMVAYGWLNHSRGGKWTEPPIEETLKRVADAGFHDVVYYPYGFLADNAESQLEGQLAAAAQPSLPVRFLPCLNGSFELAELIAGQIVTAGAGT
ncbi:MAG TPA: ferrochelatase [Vicinamibacterales bacterium]|nr:ferrochelatase [Vicinamibacterales bacterium]